MEVNSGYERPGSDKKIRVGIVNYLNTLPLIYGLERPPIKDKIELIGAYPSRLAQMLIDGEIDLGLIPVAAIPKMPSWPLFLRSSR